MRFRESLKVRLAGTILVALTFTGGVAQAEPRILGYYTNWSTYPGSGDFQPEMISELTDEIVYAYAQIGRCARVGVNSHYPDGYATEANPRFCSANEMLDGVQDWKLASTDPFSDFEKQNIWKTLARGKSLRRPVLLAIGGWSLSAAIRPAISTPMRRLALIDSIVKWMKKAQANEPTGGKFSGVIVEWEPNGNYWTLPPRRPDDRSVARKDLVSYYAFLKDLKTRMAYEAQKHTFTNGIVRVSVTPFVEVIRDVDYVWGGKYWKLISRVTDSVTARTMDISGPWKSAGNTGFTCPLKEDPHAPESERGLSISSTVRYLTQIADISPDKLGIGVAAFGRAYHVDAADPSGPYRPYAGSCVRNGTTEISNREIFTGKGPDGQKSGLDFPSFAAFHRSVGSWYAAASWDDQAANPLCQVTWDDAHAAMLKKRFASMRGLATITLWDLSKDIRPGDTGRDGEPLDYYRLSVLYGLSR